jgi:hypothetical protein
VGSSIYVKTLVEEMVASDLVYVQRRLLKEELDQVLKVRWISWTYGNR